MSASTRAVISTTSLADCVWSSMVMGMVVVIPVPPDPRTLCSGRSRQCRDGYALFLTHRGWPPGAARSRGLIPRSLRIALEPLEPHQLVPKAGIRGIQATRIREHEDPGVTDPLRLRSGARAHARPEERAIDGDADEGDYLRLEPGNDPRELPAPRLELVRCELGGRAGRPRNDVGQGETVRRQPRVVLVGESFRDQLCRVEQAPERVAPSGEVVADLRGAERRIDADKKDARPRAKPSGEMLHGPGC